MTHIIWQFVALPPGVAPRRIKLKNYRFRSTVEFSLLIFGEKNVKNKKRKCFIKTGTSVMSGSNVIHLVSHHDSSWFCFVHYSMFELTYQGRFKSLKFSILTRGDLCWPARLLSVAYHLKVQPTREIFYFNDFLREKFKFFFKKIEIFWDLTRIWMRSWINRSLS